jgi:predicted dehydrogenase
VTIRAGVVGLGFMGRRYAETLAQIEGVEVSAVTDIRPEVAAEVAARTGARALPDAAGLAADRGVDAVFVCTPEDAHEAAVVAALENGKHVLVEKPVSHDLASAGRIRAAARASGATVMVGHLLRFEPRWARAGQIIADGDIGEVVSLATRRVGNLGDQAVLRGRTSIPLYYGVHDLDILRWFAGREPLTMQAERRSGVLRAAGHDTDDLYCAILRFEGDILATAELGWHIPVGAAAAPSSGISVVGTRGWLRIEQGRTGLEVYAGEVSGHDIAVDVSFWPEVHGRPAGALVNELGHFVEATRTGSPPLISLDDGIEALRLSLAMEHAATTGERVDLRGFGTAELSNV